MGKEKPTIEIPDPLGDALHLMKDELATIKKTFSWIMTFVIGVLGIGFLTLLFALASLIINSYELHSATKNPSEEILELKTEIINLQTQIEGINKISVTNSSTETPPTSLP